MNPLHQIFPENDGLSAALRQQSRAVAAPKRAPAKPAPLHPMCLAMGRAFWAQEDARLSSEPVASVAAAPGQVERWHSEPPTVPGTYSIRYADNHRVPCDQNEAFAHWNGSMWSGWLTGPEEMPAYGHSLPPGFWEWLRLVKADAHLELAAAEQPSGDALIGVRLTPDVDGWIPFEITQDSVCPVPPDVDFEIRTRRHGIGINDKRDEVIWRRSRDGAEWPCDVVAYRILTTKADGGGT